MWKLVKGENVFNVGDYFFYRNTVSKFVSTSIFHLRAPDFGQHATLNYSFWFLPSTNEAVFMNALKVTYLNSWAEIIFGSRALISLSKSELFIEKFQRFLCIWVEGMQKTTLFVMALISLISVWYISPFRFMNETTKV